MSNTINYPYIPSGKTIQYIARDNQYMQAAKDYAKAHSLDDAVPTGAVVVKEGKIIGRAANGSDYHKTHECERIKRGIPTGQGYELCEGCHPKNHSEVGAVQQAKEAGYDTKGADVYLWGHWWCCEPCWNAMTAGGINHVYLMKDSETLFNKESPDNVIGKQFELA